MLPMPSGRQLDLSVYMPATKPVAALFLSHGGGSAPKANEKLIGLLNAEGFVVLAPLHLDSMSVPAADRKSLQTALPERIADMAATAEYARQRFKGLPLGGVGYSYGSLFTSMGIGALDYVAPVRVPEMKAVLNFSSPGIIPGLVNPDAAFPRVAAPMMVITGDKDVVPGFVTNPADHLLGFERAPAGRHVALVVKNGSHEFVAGNEAGFEEAVRLALAFLKAELLGDAVARNALDRFEDSEIIDIRRR